ncbi:hypothetical protein D3C80_1831020 [compost metagenome]
MHIAVVLDIEKVGMGLHHRESFGILFQPARGDKNCRRNAVFYQHIENTVIRFAHAGIKRQRDLWRSRTTFGDAQLRFNNADFFVLFRLWQRVIGAGHRAQANKRGPRR